MNIAAIERARENSPGMIDNDHAILKATVEQLRLLGHNVIFTSCSQNTEPKPDAIIHMSRTKETLEYLRHLETLGTMMFNTPQAVSTCSRNAFIRILAQNGISQPKYSILRACNEVPKDGYPMWLKRGDGWSCHHGDVAFVTNCNEATEAIQDIFSRGAKEIICSPHIEGDIIKFYGVSGTNDAEPFFRICYPDVEKTKFGLEKHNGICQKHPFDKIALQLIAFNAAKALGLDIFGGDCIVSPNGEIHIIDINDFPSFSAYRNEAAEAIARLINSRLTER